MITTNIRALTLSLVGSLALAASAVAGPGPMLMMIHGKMMVVTPLTEDVTYENGAKVTKSGMMMMKGKKMALKEGDAVSPMGVMMKPSAASAHGG